MSPTLMYYTQHAHGCNWVGIYIHLNVHALPVGSSRSAVLRFLTLRHVDWPP